MFIVQDPGAEFCDREVLRSPIRDLIKLYAKFFFTRMIYDKKKGVTWWSKVVGTLYNRLLLLKLDKQIGGTINRSILEVNKA